MSSCVLQDWAIYDCKSLNGVTVNGTLIGPEGHKLRSGDVVNFGKKVVPPEFEFVFEAPKQSGKRKEEAQAEEKWSGDSKS